MRTTTSRMLYFCLDWRFATDFRLDEGLLRVAEKFCTA